MAELTHYQVLGVQSDATAEEIKRAFRKGARHLHPDLNGGVALPQYLLVAEAHRVLSDEALRAAYDLDLRRAQEPEPERSTEPEDPAPASFEQAEEVHLPVEDEAPAAAPGFDLPPIVVPPVSQAEKGATVTAIVALATVGLGGTYFTGQMEHLLYALMLGVLVVAIRLHELRRGYVIAQLIVLGIALLTGRDAIWLPVVAGLATAVLDALAHRASDRDHLIRLEREGVLA